MADDCLTCPEGDCLHSEWVSPDDPDASFSELLAHIRWTHPRTDQTPAVLWPRIEAANRG